MRTDKDMEMDKDTRTNKEMGTDNGWVVSDGLERSKAEGAGMKMRICAAESCTGGRIAAALTARSGASEYFVGGVVAYQNEVKVGLLGVPEGLIEEKGVVSREVAEAMVRGACRLLGAEYGLASTGYAEAWQGHEVEIWVAWGTAEEVHSLCLREDFGRVKNVEIATQCVLDEFARFLERRRRGVFRADEGVMLA